MQTYLSYINDHKSNFIGTMQLPVDSLPESYKQYTSKVARKLLDEVLNMDEIEARYNTYSDDQKTVLRNELISLRSLCRVYLEYLYQNGGIDSAIMGE